MREKEAKCSGKARETLEKFLKRKEELSAEGRKKADMIAFKELRHELTPDRTHGHLDGVPVGLKLGGRVDAAILGIHQQLIRGIDYVQGEACYAVCASGGYDNNDDHGGDGAIIYTGQGGLDRKTKEHVHDQKETKPGNASLILSHKTQTPIRMLRGRSGTLKDPTVYFYDGLYKCESYCKVASNDGSLVLKFKLVPILNESKHSVIVHRKPVGNGKKKGDGKDSNGSIKQNEAEEVVEDEKEEVKSHNTSPVKDKLESEETAEIEKAKEEDTNTTTPQVKPTPRSKENGENDALNRSCKGKRKRENEFTFIV